jgi:hypothetical protein
MLHRLLTGMAAMTSPSRDAGNSVRRMLRSMAARKTTKRVATIAEIERSIHVIRGQRVMLDADLATLYGVTTRQLNHQVSRNKNRFPPDFAYQLTRQELTSLMSQIATSSSGYAGRRKLPWVFTEQGVAMLSSVLRSPTAVRVNIEIMRTFVRLRRLMATPGELVEQLTKLAETVQLHDNEIKVISRVLQQMFDHPPEPRRHIGFTHRKIDCRVLTCRRADRLPGALVPQVVSDGVRRRPRASRSVPC